MCPKPVYKLKKNELILFRASSYKISKNRSATKYKTLKKSKKSRSYYSETKVKKSRSRTRSRKTKTKN